MQGYLATSTSENWGSKHHPDAISNLFGLPLKAMTCQSTSELKLCDLPQAISTCFGFLSWIVQQLATNPSHKANMNKQWLGLEDFGSWKLFKHVCDAVSTRKQQHVGRIGRTLSPINTSLEFIINTRWGTRSVIKMMQRAPDFMTVL